MIEISGYSDLIAAFKANKIVVLDVYAEWCVPCQRMLTIMPRLEEALGDKAVIAKLDFDKQKEIAVEMYNVKKIPTFIFFVDAVESTRFEGIKTLVEIQKIVEELCSSVKNQ